MADTKITALTAITTVDPAVDVLPIVDVSDTTMAASGTTKKITSNQILGAGGTATLASATITGDLTVDTSTLKVDSTNNRVGIGTATPGRALDVIGTEYISSQLLVGTTTVPSGSAVRVAVNGTSGSDSYYQFSNGSGGGGSIGSSGGAGVNLYTFTGVVGSETTTKRLTVDSNGVFTFENVGGVAGTAMTLNSTGLGVGVTPANDKVLVSQTLGLITSTTADLSFRNIAGTAIQRIRFSDASGTLTVGSATATAYPVELGGDTVSRAVIIDGSKNVGVGVTPSAWNTLTPVQVKNAAFSGYLNNAYVTSNAYYDATFKYIAGSSRAALYNQSGGVHSWYYDSGTQVAGQNTTFTQAMTLDASGNLLVGKTAVNDFSIGFQTTQAGAVVSTLAASTNGTGSTMSVYSTGASAYRFYVGMGGTVFATNTTISAISDARLKENVQDIDVGLGAILALKPRKFDWKDGKGKDIKGDRGFIAQEFETVFPNLIDEWKDNAPEGEAPYKSVRQDLIPVLVKAIQELTARVEALEA